MATNNSFLNQVTIIGLGLIGSSLARILRDNHLARRIIGCSHSPETLAKAKELELIDAGTLIAADAVKRSEMVILCTPLSTYSTIAAQIAPTLKMGAILTDVGSVKQYAIDSITPYLRPGQFFIPAHPIAGSEQSGIEAGNLQLFVDKKVIITPATGFHGKAACDKVTHLWEACGASVMLMKAEKHDAIYADVSHAIQMIAYAYALSIEEGHAALICQQADVIFQQFIRLSASEPIMWRDITIANREAIIKAIKHFINELRKLLSLPITDLLERCADQSMMREKLGNTELPIKRSYSEDNPYFASAVALPILIASGALSAFTDTDFAGSGFRSLTAPMLNYHALTATRLTQHQSAIHNAGERFLTQLEQISNAISMGDSTLLAGYFTAANNAHKELSNH